MITDFALPAELEAHDPPEARGLARDGVRLLVSRTAAGEISHHRFRALPLLRASGGAVLNITSDAAVEAYAGWGGYGAAKAALEQASNVLAAEEPTLRVWWADPGDLRTDMHQLAFPGEDISDRPEPATVVPAFVRLVTERLPSGRYRAAHLMPREPVSS